MAEHAYWCIEDHLKCLCLTCANDSLSCCLFHNFDCSGETCPDYTPENPDKPKKHKHYKPISFENVLKGEIELCPDCLIL